MKCHSFVKIHENQDFFIAGEQDFGPGTSSFWFWGINKPVMSPDPSVKMVALIEYPVQIIDSHFNHISDGDRLP